MAVESATYLEQLNPAYPSATDTQTQAPAHLRLIKKTLRETFRLNYSAYDMDQLEASATQGLPVGSLVGLYWQGSDLYNPNGSYNPMPPPGWVLPLGQSFTRSDNGQTDTAPDLGEPGYVFRPVYFMKT